MYLDKSLPSEIRYLAIIQLKNGIDKYWRKTATNAITAEEKLHIRQGLLRGGIEEAENSLALQNALVVAKVVRVDYPQDWPEVLTDMIKLLREASRSNQLHLRRGMLMLLQVVKELSTARLRRSQTSLQSVTPEIVLLLSEIYLQKVELWNNFLNGHGEDESGAVDAMENSLLAIKILRRLLVVGYEYPHDSTEVQRLWEQSQVQFGQFLGMVSRDPPDLVSPARELVEKHLVQFSKLHVLMSTTHPASFAVLPSSIDLVRAYWGLVAKYGDSYGSETQDFSAKALQDDDKDERPIMEKLSVKGLNLLRACLKMVFSPVNTFKYRSPEVKAQQQAAVSFLKTDLLTEELVSQIANVIVTKFFVFRQIDLQAWEEDEDEWEIREEGGGDTWEFEIRPCSEKLFMDIVLNYKHQMVSPLLTFFHSVSGASQGSVVSKDAIYTALGLSAPVVCQEFDFDSFLTSTLVNDVQQVGPGYKVLRRRIAILLGQWITIKVSEQNRPLVYQIFQHLLKAEDEVNDHVVRVTAARQLRVVVDDFAFSTESFLPFASEILGRTMILIQEVENIETKLAILETIRSIAVRMETHICPFADQIVSILPPLWEASGEQHLLKQAILTLLATLVAAMKAEAVRYHGLILPLIERAVEPGSEMQVYLMEEALDLWAAILAQSPAPASQEVIGLLDSAFPLLEISSENLQTVLHIVESYVYLAPEAVLGDGVRFRLLSYMSTLLDADSVAKKTLTGLITTIVENLIRGAQSLGGSDGVSLVVKDLHGTGYSEKIFEGLHDAWQAHETSGPNRTSPKLNDVVETDYFTILARVALSDPLIFWNLLGTVGNVNEVWSWLSKEWFRHFDSMANIDRQKLSCLALTRLLELPLPTATAVLERLQDYFALWTSVVGEMLAGRDDGGDNLVWLSNEGHEYEGPEDVRKRVSAGSDPIHTVHTYDFVKERLAQIVQTCGGEAQFQEHWAVNVDRDVIEGFRTVGEKKEIPFWEGPVD